MPEGIIISDDLIFNSRVTATARAHGFTVANARTADAAVHVAETTPPACVIVDLQHSGLDVPGLMADLMAACPLRPRIIGYGSHVDHQSLRDARSAGVDLVLTRSQFVDRLEVELQNWLTKPVG